MSGAFWRRSFCLSYSAAANVTSLLTTKTGTLTVPAAASSFLKLNAGQFGFFRVLYPDAEWNKLTKALKTNPDAMAPVDRAGLLDDAFNLARAGKLPYDKALNALGRRKVGEWVYRCVCVRVRVCPGKTMNEKKSLVKIT